MKKRKRRMTLRRKVPRTMPKSLVILTMARMLVPHQRNLLAPRRTARSRPPRRTSPSLLSMTTMRTTSKL